MRQITADLKAVQLVRSPRARVTVTVEARGQNPEVPPLVWTELVSNVGQAVFRPVALVGLANGNILKFQAHPTEIRKYTIVNPELAVSWTGASFVTALASGSSSIAALRVPGTSTIRLFYQASSGNVLYIQSTNNGSSWGAPVTVYSGGDPAVLDVCVAYINDGVIVNGPWFFGFSTQALGVYTARFGYFDGAAWVTHAYGTDWRAGGIHGTAPASAAHRCFVFRSRSAGVSRLRLVPKNGAVFGAERDLDQTQAGLFGVELAYYRFCQLPEANCMLAVVGESAHGAGVHLGVGGIFTSTEIHADEPIMFPNIVGVNSQAYAGLGSVDAQGSADVYLAGDIVVWRGAAQAVTASVLEPIRYVYDENMLEIEFKAGIDALYVGQVLVVRRTLSWNTQSGSESFRAIIVRVERGTELVKVVALDALGWLGTARCRRPSTLNDGTVAGVAIVMRKLGARFGIVVRRDNSDLETAAVIPFTLAPSESLTGAAFRVGSQAEWYLVPANNATFELVMITPGDSDSGDYADVAHEYGSFPSQQPIAGVAIISDYRTLAFSYVLGTRSTDPQDGGAIAMEAGAVVPNTRPLSYSLTNSRYNTTAKVRSAAEAEGSRLRKLPVTARIEGQANLALELYDRIEVLDPFFGSSTLQFRVRRIVERYEKLLLTQIVHLGDV